MVPAELEAYLRRLEGEGEEPDEDAAPPPLPGLHDRRNLTLFPLMEQFKGYAHVRVFRLPVEEWPRTRHKDFTAIMVVRSRIRAEQDTLNEGIAAMRSLKDPPHWK